jgi:hypothetical protein
MTFQRYRGFTGAGAKGLRRRDRALGVARQFDGSPAADIISGWLFAPPAPPPPVAATLLTSGGTAGNNTTLTSASVSWAAGDLIVVALSINYLSGTTAWTCTATGLTFTLDHNSLNGAYRRHVFTALAGSSGSSTINMAGLSSDADAYQVIKITPTGGTVAAGTAQASASNTTGATNSLAGLTGYDADDYQIAFTMTAADANYTGQAGTPRAGWTEIGDTLGRDGTNWAAYVHSQISPQGGDATAEISGMLAAAVTRMIVLPIVFTASGGSRVLVAETGVFNLTGNAATLRRARRLVGETGTFGETGNDAAIRAARTVIADTGGFATIGYAAALRADRRLAADAGVFGLTGYDATLTKSGAGPRVLLADTGVFAVTGNAASLRTARKLVAAPGSFALSGNAAGVRVDRRLAAAAGVFAYSGQVAGLAAGRKIAAQTGVYSLSGQAATLRAARRLLAGAGVFSHSGQAANVRADRRLLAGGGTFSLSGLAVILRAERRLLASAGVYALSGYDADLVRSGAPLANLPFAYPGQRTRVSGADLSTAIKPSSLRTRVKS